MSVLKLSWNWEKVLEFSEKHINLDFITKNIYCLVDTQKTNINSL